MRRIFLLFLVGAVLLIPSLTLAATTSPATSTGLVPCDGPKCQLCDVVTLGQNIMNYLVTIASFIAVAIFSWAGLLMLTAEGDTGKVSRARSMFWNVLIGLVILLAAWLIIDTVMKYAFQGIEGQEGSELYKATKSEFGPWNALGGCVKLPTMLPATPGDEGDVTLPPGGGGSCVELTTGPCSVASLQSSFGSVAGQASQICNAESRGIPSTQSKTDVLINSGNQSFSIGLFQINLTQHTLSCDGKSLNCPSAFKGKDYGATIIDGRLYNECVVLAADASCNIKKAKEIYTASGNWSAWQNTAKKCNIPL